MISRRSRRTAFGLITMRLTRCTGRGIRLQSQFSIPLESFGMITFSTDHTTAIRTALFTGVIQDSDLLQAYETLLAQPDYDPTYNDLVDLRAVTRFEVSASGMRGVIAMYAPVDRLDVPTKLAIVAASDVTFGMSRMYEVLRGDDVPEQIRVFRSYEEAVAWLSEGTRPTPEESA